MDVTTLPSGTIVDIDSPAGTAIIASLRGTELTAFIGSGVSGFEPTSLPTGWAVAKAIGEVLAEGGVSRRDLLVKILSETAFEHVMERCPDPERVRAVLSAHFRDVPPNPVHGAFARLTERGSIRHLVTTNYDVGLEAAFREWAPAAPLTMVRDRDEAIRAAADAPHVLFKIHGCATEPFAGGMAFRLTDEAQLEEWKRETLRKLVAGRPLVVAAYSGMDFEICPELPRMGASRLVWLHFGKLEDLTPNARRVVRESGGVILCGSAEKLAGGLLGEEKPVEARWSPGAARELVAALFARFDDEERDAWRARLFGEIGCGRDAAEAADRLLARADARDDGAARARALSHRARGRFHQGRYLDAADDYAHAARLLRDAGDAHELRGALNGVAECNRCAGRFGRTMLALRTLGRFARNDAGDEHEPARADRRMLGLLFRRHAYQLASVIPRRRGLRRLRKRLRSALRELARRDLGQVAEHAAASGNWLQLQQAMLWTRRYGLHWSAVHRGPMSPLASRDGYWQLGYVVARSMAIRDERRAPEASEVKELLEVLAEIGAWPEAWKLLRFAEKRLGRSEVPEATRVRIEDGWRTCQYTFAMRRAREMGLF
jgi:hypothetical protein